MFVEQACNMYSLTIVPLYDTLGPEACVYIINQGKFCLFNLITSHVHPIVNLNELSTCIFSMHVFLQLCTFNSIISSNHGLT